MKSFEQLSEDIEARRVQLKQRSQERMQRFKDQSASSLASAKQKAEAGREMMDANNQAAAERAQEYKEKRQAQQQARDDARAERDAEKERKEEM